MQKGKLTIKFFIRNPDNKKKASVYVRCVFQRQKIDIALSEHVDMSDWNPKTGRAKKDDKLNYHLDKLYDYIIEYKRQASQNGTPFSIPALKEKLLLKLGVIEDRSNLLWYFKDHIKRIREMNQDYSLGTVKQYVTTLMTLEEYLQKKFKTATTLSQVDYRFIKEFDEHMKTRTPQLMQSTIQSRHSKFRAVIYDAYKKGLILSNPYMQFKVKSAATSRTFLSQQEIDALEMLDLSNNACLERVRDLFLFSVYTGLRFSDAQDLRKENLISGNGHYYISKVIKKTGRQFMLPLLTQAYEILEKYRYMEHVDARLLPVISNQKLNKYIKYVGDLAGITKKLSHHVARHSFATTIALSNNVPVEVVQQWLGHSNIRETMIYAKVTAYHSTGYATMLNEKFLNRQQFSTTE